MPVIIATPQDPTDLVMQGEQMRMAVSTQVNDVAAMNPMLPGLSNLSGFSSCVPDEDAFPPMNSFIEGNRLSIRRMANGQLQIRDQAGISTPCGAWIWLDYTPLLNPLMGSSSRWMITGVTRDSAGAALGNCRVVALETGRIAVASSPVVSETISDGSGNYSIEVALDVSHWMIAYKPGAPDVGGVSLNSVTPTQA